MGFKNQRDSEAFLLILKYSLYTLEILESKQYTLRKLKFRNRKRKNIFKKLGQSEVFKTHCMDQESHYFALFAAVKVGIKNMFGLFFQT